MPIIQEKEKVKSKTKPKAGAWLPFDFNDKKTFFLVVLCILLLGVVITESALLYIQHKVNRQIEAQSQRALERFQRGDQSKAEAGFGTYIKLQNVSFGWSPKIVVSIPNLSAKALPLNKARSVNFDNLTSFILKVYKGDVYIKPSVLQGMFNESVFNYPNSKLRNLTVNIVSSGANPRLRLGGSLNFVLWIPFEMLVRLSVDKVTNTLVIEVDKLKVFGFIPATKLTDFQPFRLEKLLTVPANKHLYVRQNRIMVKPFGLFPPPKVDGKMTNVSIERDTIKLSFNNANVPRFIGIPNQGAKNFIYLDGGSTKFGRLNMQDTQIQLIDANMKDYFSIYLAEYFKQLPSSKVQLKANGSLVVEMNDF